MEEAKNLINSFYQPLGKLNYQVSNSILWDYAKQRALETCKKMLEENSIYTANDRRWSFWAQMEINVNNL